MKINIIIYFKCKYSFFYECISSVYSQLNVNRDNIYLHIYDDGTPRDDDEYEFSKYEQRIYKLLSYFNYKYKYKNIEYENYCNPVEAVFDMIDISNNNEIVIFLDGDDKLLHRNVLSEITELYKNNEKLKMILGKIYRSDGNNSIVYPQYTQLKNNELNLYDVVRKLSWACWHLKTIRSECLLNAGLHRDMFKIDNEWVLPADQVIFFQIIENNKINFDEIYYVNDYNYYYRIHDKSKIHEEQKVERKKKLTSQENIIRKKETDFYKNDRRNT